MMMKKLSLKTKIVLLSSLFNALLIAVPVHAASGGGIVGSPNDRLVLSDTECAGCPADPKAAGAVSFEKLEALFAKSQAPVASRLRGDWKMVLKVSHPAFDDSNLPGQYNQLSKEGLKTKEGYLWRALSFDVLQASGWGDETNVTATLHGLEAFDYLGVWGRSYAVPPKQGPYAVETRDQSVCFAQYGYTYSRSYSQPQAYLIVATSYVPLPVMERTSNATFSYACRQPPDSGDRLICAVTPHGQEFPETQKPWIGRVIEYVGYEKIK